METLLTQALGRGAPWRAVSVDFKPGEGPIAFEIESTAKRATCPACGAVEQLIHDRLTRTWRHLNFSPYQTVLNARVPPVACTACEKNIASGCALGTKGRVSRLRWSRSSWR